MKEGEVASAAPDDANDLRGFHFKRLLGKPLTWALIGIEVVIAGVAVAVLVGPAIGAAAALGAFLLGLLVVFAIADSRAEGSFFDAYTSERGMALTGKGPLPPSTPLLRRGDDRYAVRAMSGPLADGVDGVLALYTYEVRSTDGKQIQYYGYTLGMVDVPECASLLPELICQRKLGPRALEKLEDAFRGSKQRVELESEAFDERYEIFVNEDQDQVWLRRLFSPTFIVWLGEEAPEKFAFELVDGVLCCYVSGHKKSAAELDTIRTASAAVAARLREEALE
jgi:hypothetical protein